MSIAKNYLLFIIKSIYNIAFTIMITSDSPFLCIIRFDSFKNIDDDRGNGWLQ